MSYPDALDSLIARVQALAPSWDADLPFYTLEDTDAGTVVELEAVPDDVVRLFDVRMAAPPVDAGGAGYGLSRFTVDMELRVRYPAHPRQRSERQIGADVPLLCNALVHPALPLPWHESIDTIEPPGRPTLAELAGPESVRALILSIPFTLHFLAPQEA